jgi:NAD(P)H-hydrate epimerase
MNANDLPILATADVRSLDATAIRDFGLSGLELMTRAGRCLVDRIAQLWPSARTVQVVAGPGNNGGDGYVAARLLHEQGIAVRVVAPLGLPSGGDAWAACAAYRAVGGVIDEGGVQCGDSELILDAFLGTGLSRDLSGLALAAIEAMNASGLPILAADTPSGLDTDRGVARPCVVQAAATVTFGAEKPGFHLGVGPDCVGQLSVENLGIPMRAYASMQPVLRVIPAALVASVLPKRKRTAHKGDHGRVVIVGGGPGMPGAVRLAGEAALRAGAGLVTIVTHPSHAASIAMSRPELICVGLDGSGSVRALLESADVVAIGPGLGQTAWARDLFAEALDGSRPLVVDADALNLLAQSPVRRGNWILTPHPGEAARLLGCSSAEVQVDRLGALAALVSRYDATVVLKGARSLVGGPQVIAPWLCRDGNPGMATAGMGDVLTGIVAAIAAQQASLQSLADVAAVSVQVHASAGDLSAYAEAYAGERGLLAGDLLANLRRAVNP